MAAIIALPITDVRRTIIARLITTVTDIIDLTIPRPIGAMGPAGTATAAGVVITRPATSAPKTSASD